jgi:hypothetical protein
MFLELDVNTFGGNLQLATLGDLDVLDWLVTSGGLELLNLVNNVVAFEDFAENDVSAIEPRGDDCGDEELRSVGVRASVGHGERARLDVLELEVLILELGAVDGLATSAVVVGEVTTLDHEVLDNSVESRAFVTKALLAGSKSSEVLGCLGHSLAVETHNDTAEILVTMLDVEVHLVSDLGTLGSLNVVGEEDQSHSKKEGNRDKESAEIDHDAVVLMKRDRKD